MKKLILSCSLLALTAPAYAALDCNVLPTCEDLGYAYAVDQCEDQAVLKCPFDNAKVFCGEPQASNAEKCIAEEYSNVTKGCLGTYREEPCPYDASYIKCVLKSCFEINSSYFSNVDQCTCQYGAIATRMIGSDGTCYKCGTAQECKGTDNGDGTMTMSPCKVCTSPKL